MFDAAWAGSEDNEELPVVGSLAEAYCSDPSFHAAAENVQIHGGIGFTGELPAHLYCINQSHRELPDAARVTIRHPGASLASAAAPYGVDSTVSESP
jgi:alkylation response protein AidB-like acyl-CoA dehydrogenase